MADDNSLSLDTSIPAAIQHADPGGDEVLADEDASQGIEAPGELDLDEELEELIIEDFTIDGICGVY